MTSGDEVYLYEPINTLKAVGEDIWIVDGPLIRMNVRARAHERVQFVVVGFIFTINASLTSRYSFHWWAQLSPFPHG